MTSYHGGNQKIGKQIASTIHMVSTIMEEETEYEIKGYCEPFCGMLGVYRHIPGLFEGWDRMLYIAGDANASVIKMWKKTKEGWIPPTTCTRTKFDTLRKSTISSAEKGFLGHACCFGGQYFNTFSTDKVLDLPVQSKRVQDISQQVQLVKFSSGSYDQFSSLRGYVIYCDPPYSGTTTRYFDEEGRKRSFDYKLFEKWCQDMALYNIVFVSEYNTLDIPAVKVWTKKGKASIYKGRKALGSESLFVVL